MSFFKKAENFIKDTANSTATKWKNSSTRTKVCIVAAPATAVVVGVAAPLLILPALGVVGFTSAGVAAGSIAASVQTATTVSGSIFALCQSAAATGIIATSTSVGVGLAAGATAGGVTAAVLRDSSDNSNNDGQGHAETEEDAPDEIDQSLDFHNSNMANLNPQGSQMSSIS